jgi:hypothetical protein
MGWTLRRPHGPSRRAGLWPLGVVDFRSARFPGASVPSHRHQDLLSGFERPSQARSLNFFCWYVERSGAGAGPIAQLARARA